MVTEHAASDVVERAAEVLRGGGIVVLPTETVYGLAADAENPRAVARVYAIKGRPADHPLILHLAGGDLLPQWSANVRPYAQRLADALWPGPLTIVVPRSARVGDWVTGGQDCVALRVPDHPVALAVLEAFGGALAAPSANCFGRVSPTTVDHVRQELGELLDEHRDLFVDGGRSSVGVESTIVDCNGPAPVILRPGRVSAEQIAEACGVPVASTPPDPVRVPGSLNSHYAPHAAVDVVSLDNVPDETGEGVGFLALADVPTPAGAVRLSDPGTSTEYARALYAALREADSLRLDLVIAVPPGGDDALSAAIRDRLSRAAAVPR